MIGSWQQPSLYSSTTKTSSEMDRAWVYLVTGGCGFIGEKIVEVLSQQDYIKEVRVFGSVAREEVEKFTTGTENVLRACCILNIPYVVYTSSIAAVGPNTLHEPMFRANEDTKYSGEVELPYGKTKAMAEKLVVEVSGKKVQKSMVAPAVLQHRMGRREMVRKTPQLISKRVPENTEHNYTYVGNVAWMHVLAARNLQLKPDLLAEQVCYSYDDTPTRKGFLIRHQLLSSVNPSVRLGSHIPYWKMWLMIQLHRIIRVILYPFWKPQPFLNLSLLNTVVTTFSYETDKASRYFGYKPLFTWKESKHRTAQWLEAAAGNLEQPQLHEKNS
uniref:3-beta hydroxysteroid dehydrogenase/isomerase domain-containing protein n=1 Tax=Strix occidentalis caurina TaxID=311401 RepID=A0A8D0FEJ1_STROC